MYFPNGLAGLYESHGKKWLAKLFGSKSKLTLSAMEASK